jgi:hypothetical protein
MPAENGNLSISSMDQLIWIFGITLLMLLAPSFTFSLIKGSVASTADAVGVKMMGVGAQALVSLPIIFGLGKKVFGKGKGKGNKNNFKSPQNFQPYSRKYSSDRMSNLNSNKNSFQGALKEKSGLSTERSNNNSVKLSEMKMSQQNTKQNSSASSGSNLPNHENVKTNGATSKIPSGSFNTSQIQNQNRSDGIMKINSNSNPNSNFVPKSFQSSSRPPTNNTMTSGKNIFKQVQPRKVIETKSRLSRIMPKDLGNLLPKERQREV